MKSIHSLLLATLVFIFLFSCKQKEKTEEKGVPIDSSVVMVSFDGFMWHFT